jgi:hypothetical protein
LQKAEFQQPARGHRVEAEGLAVPLWALEGLAKDE